MKLQKRPRLASSFGLEWRHPIHLPKIQPKLVSSFYNFVPAFSYKMHNTKEEGKLYQLMTSTAAKEGSLCTFHSTVK